jgi:signal transduction histidine kinase
MFFRLSGKTEGSGIGLYIVKETVQKLEGSIQVESELGTGTTFIITLKNLKP